MSLRFGLFYYCYQVVNFANHTASASIVFEFYNLVKATIQALGEMRDARTVAQHRGVSLDKVFRG